MNKHTMSFDEIYRKYHKRTYLFIKSYIHNEMAAEDIASEALIAIWETTKKHEITHPITFLFSIARNKSIDYLRHDLTHQETLEKMSEIGIREIRSRVSTLEACNPENIYSNEIYEIVEATLNSLPQKTKKAFMMSRFEDLSRKEIAEALGITTKGVEYHITVALKALRIQLKDYLPYYLFFFFYH